MESRPEIFAFSVSGQRVNILRISAPSNTFWKDQDIALLIIDRDITTIDFPVVQLKPLTDLSPLTIVGFGLGSDKDSFGTKRLGTVFPTELFKAAPDAIWSGKRLMLSALPNEKDQIACSGDSGGPVFRTREDGSVAIVGLIQGSPAADPLHPCDSADELLITPLSEHKKWLNDQLQK